MTGFYEMLKESPGARQRPDNAFLNAFANDAPDGDRALRLKDIFLAMAKGGADAESHRENFQYFRHTVRNVSNAIEEGLKECGSNQMTAAVAAYLETCHDMVKELGLLKEACAAARASAVAPRDTLEGCFSDILAAESQALGLEIRSIEKTPFYAAIVETAASPSRRADLVGAIFVASGASALERDWRLLEFGQFVNVLHGASRQQAERIAKLMPGADSAEAAKKEFHSCEKMIEFCDVLKDGCVRAGGDFHGDTKLLGEVRDGFAARRQRIVKLWQLVAGSQREPDPEDKISVYRPLQIRIGA